MDTESLIPVLEAILFASGDPVSVERLEKALENPRFLQRWFTAAEREYLAGRRAESAAGLFAAKEAAAKALGSGFSGFGPDSVEIDHDGRGRPLCRLRGGAAARLKTLGGERVLVSVSHDGGLAMAFAAASLAAKMPAALWGPFSAI